MEKEVDSKIFLIAIIAIVVIVLISNNFNDLTGAASKEAGCTSGWICVSNNTKAFQFKDCRITTYKDCPYGCKNGICLSKPQLKCIDSDGGKNYYTKGIIKKYKGSELTFREEDVCKDISIIVNGDYKNVLNCKGNNCGVEEYYCNTAGTDAGSTLYNCPSGACSYGACGNITGNITF